MNITNVLIIVAGFLFLTIIVMLAVWAGLIIMHKIDKLNRRDDDKYIDDNYVDRYEYPKKHRL